MVKAISCSVVILIALVIILSLFLFTVDEREQAVVTQFGRVVKVVTKPGLNTKLPFIQSVQMFDDRVLEYDAEPAEIITKDKKTMAVDNYARWRIIDPKKFLEAVRNEFNAQARLDDIIYSELRVELGKHDLAEVISSKRVSIMDIVTKSSNEKAADYGIEVVDVRMKRADLPAENKQAIFNRMKTEREREAKRYRSEGREEALKIRADTDKEKVIILADAYQTAEKTRGEGDAKAIETYANAFGKDPEFFSFLRSLEAYRKSISENTTLVLPADSEFFKYMTEGGK